MFDKFLESFNSLQRGGVEDPLYETLRLFDILTEGALRKSESLSLWQNGKIDLASLARKRMEGMPLEYILERAIFMGRTFYCNPNTLIPTEETRLLVNAALVFIREQQESKSVLTLLDIGTGCGNLAISIAIDSDNVNVLASDISPEAVDVAKRNVSRFNLQERVSLFCGDLLSPFKGAEYKGNIDIIVCNPPYIPTGSLSKLPSEIIDYEPTLALDAGPYGINIFRRLILESLELLKPKGNLLFEIGEGQEKMVERILKRNHGYEDIRYLEIDDKIRAISAVKA